MSGQRQEELSGRLDQVLALPAVASLHPEPRTPRIHHDWLEAGEHTQRTVAQLSQQLRRFLDDRAFLENRRILDLLHGIETRALALRDELAAAGRARLELPAAAGGGSVEVTADMVTVREVSRPPAAGRRCARRAALFAR